MQTNFRSSCRVYTGLKEGNHLYDFKIDSKFFASFEKSEIHEAELEAVISLIKRSSHMEVRIKITGTVILICDRCLDLYTQEFSTEDRILIKFGEQWEEVDDEIIMIPFGESEFKFMNLHTWVYLSKKCILMMNMATAHVTRRCLENLSSTWFMERARMTHDGKNWRS